MYYCQPLFSPSEQYKCTKLCAFYAPVDRRAAEIKARAEQGDGTGTYEDPVTLAVGHDLSTGADVLDWPAGTRFYDPALRRYLGVEDTCGDGPAPQNGACHVPGEGAAPGVATQVDVWIDGRALSAEASARCASAVTSSRWLIVNPQPGYPVDPGEIAVGCPDVTGGQQ